MRRRALIRVNKVWEDGDNQDSTRPDSVTAVLYKTINGTKTKVEEAVLNNANSWTKLWTDLDVF